MVSKIVLNADAAAAATVEPLPAATVAAGREELVAGVKVLVVDAEEGVVGEGCVIAEKVDVASCLVGARRNEFSLGVVCESRKATRLNMHDRGRRNG
jgi:hypothetical protein